LQYITNGIELGYIKPPGYLDPAYDTPKMLKAAIREAIAFSEGQEEEHSELETQNPERSK
jgi:hypothetical protein